MKPDSKILATISLVALISCDALNPGDLKSRTYIDITTLPTGCEVYLNGVKQPDTTDCMLDSVPREQGVIVRLIKGDYIDWCDTFDLTGTDTLFIDEAFTGTLEIGSNPDGAEILLEDTSTGFTTFRRFENVNAGPYKITLKKDTYTDWEEVVTVYPGDTARIDAILETQAQQIEWILIPAGWFTMGADESDPDAQFDEKPAHDVYLDAFYVSKYEITNAQYCEFLNVNGNTYQGQECVELTNDSCEIYYSGGRYYVEQGKADYPIMLTSWYGAKGYCEWIGARLPTEAEWEKAARGDDMRLYAWGNDQPSSSLANYAWNIGRSTPIGSYPDGASACGCLDISGNVMEWTKDWYKGDYYEESPDSNPQGPETGLYPVKRGGSWASNYWKLRCTYRHYDTDYPFAGWDDVGIRPVRD